MVSSSDTRGDYTVGLYPFAATFTDLSSEACPWQPRSGVPTREAEFSLSITFSARAGSGNTLVASDPQIVYRSGTATGVADDEITASWNLTVRR